MKSINYLGIILLSVGVIGCGRPNIANLDSLNGAIVCFGDSITAGKGVGEDQSFCAYLSEKIKKPILNEGVSGETSKDALRRIQTSVLDYNPKLVFIEFGANDFFHKMPIEKTFENIDSIVSQVQEKGAIAVILSVKVGLMNDVYYQGFKQIAKKRKALIIPDIMKGVLLDPRLKVDSIHPNSEGHKIIAERVYQRIKSILKYL